MSDLELKTLKKSTRVHKKYMVLYKGKWIHFGDNRYEQYEDSTPLKLYADMNHFDERRRELYYMRHGKTTDKSSAKYWSNKYLW